MRTCQTSTPRSRARSSRPPPRLDCEDVSAPARYTARDMVAVPLIFGLVIGSFLNVVIARLPEGRSIWRPRSSCPRCGTQIAWYDNIPLLSFVILRGRCRACGQAIALRYPLVEAATGALFALAFLVFGPT